MVVLFAVLVVAVVGAAVLIAVRFPRVGQLPDVVPDQAVTHVPADGPLTSEDLRRVRFPVVFRGYRMADVDALLDRLADQQSASPPAGAVPSPPHGDVPQTPAVSPAAAPNATSGSSAQWEATP